MMVVMSSGEQCCELFELFCKESIQSQMQSRETEIGWGNFLWIKLIAAPIIPSCKSWFLTSIS